MANAQETNPDAPPIVVRNLADLVPTENNPRTHSDDQVDRIAASIQEFGWTSPLLVAEDEDGWRILAGHGRVAAAIKLGIDSVPTLDLSRLSPEQRMAYVIADNKLAEDAGWHSDTLAEIFENLNQAGFALDVTGFSFAEAEDIMKAARRNVGAADGVGGQEGEDDFGEVQENATTRFGDEWRMGGHRLICADSMKADTFEKLIGDDQVHMIATDPPYAIYGSATGIASDISDDKMVRPFFDKVLTIAKDRLEWFGHAYVFCDWRSWPAIWEACKGVPHIEPKNLLMWDKGGAGLGSNYANTYECVAFFAKLPKQTAMGNRPSGQRPVHKPNVLRHNRPSGADRLHNAAKPVALLRELIENSSGPGDVVLDPFTGSGSVTIAADQTDRICLSVEIDPGWCDVVLNRFHKLREIEPELVASDDGITGTLAEVVAARSS